jgi:hypothetical protein
VRRLDEAALVAAALLAFGNPALGQTTAAPRRHSLEIAAGAVLMSGIDFGSRSADLTADAPGDPAFPLFHTSTKLGAGGGAEGRIAFNVTRTFAVEGGFLWVRQTQTTRITGDVEGAPDTTVSRNLDTYYMGGALVMHLSRAQFAKGRGLPFLLAGASYRRQLDDGQFLLDSGPTFDAGGGVKYFFRQRPHGVLRDIGVRAEGRISVQSLNSTSDLDDRSTRVAWILTGAAVLRF